MPAHENARPRLLDAATRLFSEKGFAGVSTRCIADAAQTTLPAIAHHFGSKEGLYKAVLEGIAQEVERNLAQVAAAARSILADERASREQILEVLVDLFAAHARMMLQSRPEWASLMVQEVSSPSLGFESMKDALGNNLLTPAINLVAALRVTSPHNPEVRLQVLSLVARIVGLRMLRGSVLRMMNWSAMTPARTDAIVKVLGSEINAIFR